MKSGRLHRVPLTAPMLDLLHAMRPDVRLSHEPVFPGARPDRPLSSMALAMTIRRMNDASSGRLPWVDARGDAIVPHGFRSTFRDWAGETTSHSREVIEAALAHTLRDKVEAAYARGDLFAKRQRLMTDWADFCIGKANST